MTPTSTQPAKTNGPDLYAQLRVSGEVSLRPDDLGGIATARRLAKADGLVVVTSKSSARGLSTWQARARHTTVSLTTDGIHLTAPDRAPTSR